MANNRYVGGYPVIGIRPIVDGRRGPMMLRESLEPLVRSMAEAAKKLRTLSGGKTRDAVKLIVQGIFEQCQ